ncbi:MAG: hypothetical protein M3440_05115 [Chloroflexota bacterium]|nr:hypothetical protein [Chloroflexota bacterium]
MAITSTIIGAAWSLYRNANHLLIDGTTLYVVTAASTGGTTTVTIWLSTDAGASWSSFATNSYTGVEGNISSSIRSSVIAFSSSVSSTSLFPAGTYTISTNTWSLPAASTRGNAITGVTHLEAEQRPSAGTPMTMFQTADGAVMGASYRRIAQRDSAGGSALNGSVQIDYDGYSIVPGAAATNRVHMFYTAITTGAVRTLHHRTSLTGTTAGTESASLATLSATANYPVGRGTSYVSGANTIFVVPYVDSSGALKVASATSADSPTAANFAHTTVTTTAPETANANPAVLVHDGTNLRCYVINDAQTAILESTLSGSTWSTPASIITGTSINGINAWWSTANGGGPAILYDDNGTLTFSGPGAGAAPADPKSAPDSQAIASSDTGTVAVTSTRTDSQALASSDTASISAQTAKSAPDAQALASTDTATGAIAATVADTQALGSSESASILEQASKSAIDTQALGSSDQASISDQSAYAAPDAQALASSDTATTSITSTTADTQSLTSSDTATATASVASTDTQTLTSTDAATLATTATATDTQALASIDSASISEQSTKAATDSQALGSSDAASIIAQTAKSAADAQALASVDTAGVAGDGLATDTTIIVGTDGVTLQVAGVASDSGILGSSESVSVVVTMVVSDTQAVTGSDTATAAEVLEVYYPWPSTVTFTAVGGPAVSLTAISSPAAQPGAIADAPAVSLSAISVLTVTLAGVSDGPATALSSIAGSTASIVSIATPDGAWTAIADPADISGVVPGPDATISIIALPGSTFTAVPVPSGTGSLIPEPTASVAAISDGPAITPTVYTMPEG